MLALFLALPACADDAVQGTVTDTAGPGEKGVVDVPKLETGVTVKLGNRTGSVEVPFSVKVPDVSDADLEAELEKAVSLVVSSDISGATANLSSGKIVDGMPTGAGEFMWELNEDRDLATLTFFNETISNLTLKVGRPYTALMQVTENEYIETVPEVSLAVTVQ